MKKITFNLNILVSFVAVVLFAVFLTLALGLRAQDVSNDIAKQQDIIKQAQLDFEKGVIKEEEYLNIIQKAEEEIKILEKNGGGVSTPGLSGYAWSENIGWISFEGMSIDGNPYQVTLDPYTNYLVGDAWSENIGWVHFDPGYFGPTGGDPNFRHGALYDPDTGKITGWAQVESFNNDGECVPAGSVCSNNIADGWISFNGTTTDGGEYGVTFELDTGMIKGFGGGGEPALDIPERWAWGGEAIGWIDMGWVTINTESSVALLTLETNKTSIYVNDNITLNWFSPDGSVGSSGPCTTSLMGGSSNWTTYTPGQVPGNFTIDNLTTPGNYTFGITCEGLGNSGSASGYVTVYVSNYPVPAITLGSSCVGGANTGVVTLNSFSNFSTGSHSCVSSPANSLWSTLPSVGSSKNNLANSTYTLTCIDGNTGVSSSPVSVTVQCPVTPPTGTGSGNKIPNYIEN